MLLMAYTENNLAGNGAMWYLDFRCSNHMTGNKSLFYDLNENFREKVKLGYDSSMNVMGKGSVKMLMNKKMQNVGDVFYIPELKNNLISLGQLQKIGYSIMFQKGSCQIYDLEKGLVADIKMSRN